MSKRGRPPDWDGDVTLVRFVRRLIRAGAKVAAACDAYREQEGHRGPSIEALVRRYYRISTAYPRLTGAPYQYKDVTSLIDGKTRVRLVGRDSLLDAAPIRKPS